MRKISVRQKLLLPKNLTSLFSFMNLGMIQGSNALIQLLLVYVVTRVVGLEEFGHVSVGTTYAMLVSMFINYGSNQSGVKDVALFQQDSQKLAGVFFTTYTARSILYLGSLVILLVVDSFFHLGYGKYFLLANLLILSETLNPFFFFVGIQRLLLYNLGNLAGKILSAAAVCLLVKSKSDGPWVNFYMGAGNTLTYGLLLLFIAIRYKLCWRWNGAALAGFFKKNLYLTGNNISVQLQQSFFLLAVSTTGNAWALGAYSLCDKLLTGFRMVIIAFSNAVYPRAVLSYQQDRGKWAYYKKRINLALFGVFTLAGIVLFVFASPVTHILTRGENELAIYYIRCISFVPLVAALNAMNVIDLLMKDKYHYIFRIALILFGVTVCSSLIFLLQGNASAFGYYPITVEICALPLYAFYIKRTKANSPGS